MAPYFTYCMWLIKLWEICIHSACKTVNHLLRENASKIWVNINDFNYFNIGTWLSRETEAVHRGCSSPTITCSHMLDHSEQQYNNERFNGTVVLPCISCLTMHCDSIKQLLFHLWRQVGLAVDLSAFVLRCWTKWRCKSECKVSVS